MLTKKSHLIQKYTKNLMQKYKEMCYSLKVLKYPRYSHYMLKNNLLLEWPSGLRGLFLNFILGAEGMGMGSVGSVKYMKHTPDQRAFICGEK